MLEVCSGVTNEKEKGRGVREARSGPTGRVEGDQISAMSWVFKRVLEGLSAVDLVNLNFKEVYLLRWRECIPFYRWKGMALQVRGREFGCF